MIAELNRRLEHKAKEIHQLVYLIAIPFWLVWIAFDYVFAQELFNFFVIIRFLGSFSNCILYLFIKKNWFPFKIIVKMNLALYFVTLTLMLSYVSMEALVPYFYGYTMIIIFFYVLFVDRIETIYLYTISFSISFILITFLHESSALQVLKTGGFIVLTIFITMTFAGVVIFNSKKKEILSQLKFEQKNIELQNQIEEKEALLTEVHHRVKNNLQIITSLVNLEKEKTDISSAKEVLMKTQERIKSIALIHEKLYISESFSSISLQDYVIQLLTDFNQVYDFEIRNISIEINIKNINLTLEKAAPCGILINELITNCIKYAFDEKGGTISVEGTCKDSVCQLTIKDNGKGFPKNIDEIMNKSIGLRLSKGLAKQLGGSLSLKSENGAQYLIKFST